MNILVCIKQVPSSEDVRFDEKGNMLRESCDSALNYSDDYALESALNLKAENPDTKIIVLTMGPTRAEEALRYCLSRGADEAFLLTDPLLKGADTLITARALHAAAKKISRKTGNIDLFLCGAKSSDGETGHVPSQLAELAGLPDLVFIDTVKKQTAEQITATSIKEGTKRTFAVKLPCVISLQPSKEISIKLPSIAGKMRAKRMTVEILTAEDIGMDTSITAEKASPTWVGKYYENKWQTKAKETKFIKPVEIVNILKKGTR